MLITLAVIAFLLLTDIGRCSIILFVGMLTSVVLGLSTTLVGAVLAGWIMSRLLF